MFAKLTKLAALRGAGKILEARTKIAAALQAELGKFQTMIRDRRDAERAVVEAETAAALGEPAEPAAAIRKFDQISSSIARQAAILGGLRVRMAAMASQLDSERQAVSAALPEHIERVKSDFARRWAQVVTTFGELLSERQALQALIGNLDLPEPKPGNSELPTDIQMPWQVLDQLKAALDEIAGWSRAAIWPDVDAMSPRGAARPFDPAKAYVLTVAQDGLGAGELVMEASFAPGILAHLVNIGYAVPDDDNTWRAAVSTGAQLAQRAASESEAARLRAAEPAATAYPPEILQRSAEANADLKRLSGPIDRYPRPMEQILTERIDPSVPAASGSVYGGAAGPAVATGSRWIRSGR